MDAEQHTSYRIPPRRPSLMAELHRQLPSVNDRINWLSALADPTEYEQITDDLYAVFITARDLAPVRNATGCSRHPNGPVDTEAPAGWGLCLLCNTSRRIGNPSARAAPELQRSMWVIPQPPYDHRALTGTMKTLNEAVADLGFCSPDLDFERVADLVHCAFWIARELARPPSESGCSQHPNAPIDHDAPGGPQCLFCLGRQRRALLGEPTVNVRPSRPLPAPRRPPRTWLIHPTDDT
ncbi:hypothetical protein [Streptomyces acidiscabies]|uniref:hypothetical protein n=1 Tax=Streptomyces acidiscabies TaxID=42234 RepID=UPI0015BB9404|nr:hypothetical protein [Streptomyces acidiscabies]